jgi:hypothetical protein
MSSSSAAKEELVKALRAGVPPGLRVPGQEWLLMYIIECDTVHGDGGDAKEQQQKQRPSCCFVPVGAFPSAAAAQAHHDAVQKQHRLFRDFPFAIGPMGHWASLPIALDGRAQVDPLPALLDHISKRNIERAEQGEYRSDMSPAAADIMKQVRTATRNRSLPLGMTEPGAPLRTPEGAVIQQQKQQLRVACPTTPLGGSVPVPPPPPPPHSVSAWREVAQDALRREEEDRARAERLRTPQPQRMGDWRDEKSTPPPSLALPSLSPRASPSSVQAHDDAVARLHAKVKAKVDARRPRGTCRKGSGPASEVVAEAAAAQSPQNYTYKPGQQEAFNALTAEERVILRERLIAARKANDLSTQREIFRQFGLIAIAEPQVEPPKQLVC